MCFLHPWIISMPHGKGPTSLLTALIKKIQTFTTTGQESGKAEKKPEKRSRQNQRLYIPCLSNLVENAPILPKRSRRALKTIAFSDVFVTPFSRKVYEDGNLQKLEDKGLYSCMLVVAADRRNLRLFEGLCHFLIFSVCGSFARHLFAISGLFRAS